jgi:hypothetical protein
MKRRIDTDTLQTHLDTLLATPTPEEHELTLAHKTKALLNKYRTWINSFAPNSLQLMENIAQIEKLGSKRDMQAHMVEFREQHTYQRQEQEEQEVRFDDLLMPPPTSTIEEEDVDPDVLLGLE